MSLFGEESAWVDEELQESFWRDDGEDYEEDTTPATDEEIEDHTSDDTVPIEQED